MKTEKKTGQIHRFHDNVAVYLGDGSTCYLAPAVARRIARALNACANDIARHDFIAGTFRTHEFTLTNADEAAPRTLPPRVLRERARVAAKRAERDAAKGGA